MKILLYDVETANKIHSGSICSVGWILLENSEIIDSGYSLINPHCSFNIKNVEIHGITSSDVENSPCFAEYWDSTLKPMMSSCLVVSHNAAFDLSETEQALYNAGIDDPGIDYFDTLEMFHYYIETDSYKLTSLCEHIGYSYNAHNALEDVKALYAVLQFIMNALGFSDLPELIIRSHVASENTLSNSYFPKKVIQKVFSYDNSSRCRENVEIIDHRFSNLRFCFTGDIPGYDRSDLERLIKQHDGRMTSAVSGKTDYLVVGSYEDFGPNYISGKYKAAQEIMNNGGKIKIIDPSLFFVMLENLENDQ